MSNVAIEFSIHEKLIYLSFNVKSSDLKEAPILRSKYLEDTNNYIKVPSIHEKRMVIFHTNEEKNKEGEWIQCSADTIFKDSGDHCIIYDGSLIVTMDNNETSDENCVTRVDIEKLNIVFITNINKDTYQYYTVTNHEDFPADFIREIIAQLQFQDHTLSRVTEELCLQ